MSGQRQSAFVRAIWSVVRVCGLGPLVLALYPKSALVKNGWFKSFRCGFSIDASGNPIPWLPYSMIDFLDSRLDKSLTLFEYGCGYSTVWYCSHVKQVTSVESDQGWATRAQSMLPPNGKVLHYDDPNDYVCAIDTVGKVDVVVVDGIVRTECYRHLGPFLSERGVIIADDSAREDFKACWPEFEAQGFKCLTFTGLTPGHFVKSQTSILYRPDNCLGI